MAESCLGGLALAMAPRLALLLLFAGRTSAQLSCATQQNLLDNLSWVREACEEQGEAFADADTLVPSSVRNAHVDFRRFGRPFLGPVSG